MTIVHCLHQLVEHYQGDMIIPRENLVRTCLLTNMTIYVRSVVGLRSVALLIGHNRNDGPVGLFHMKFNHRFVFSPFA
jgi:hypothetical protein